VTDDNTVQLLSFSDFLFRLLTDPFVPPFLYTVSQIQNEIFNRPEQVRSAEPFAHGEDAKPTQDASASGSGSDDYAFSPFGLFYFGGECECDATGWYACCADGRRFACACAWNQRWWTREEEA